MTDGHIQHKRAFVANDPCFGFDDNGTRVPIVQPATDDEVHRANEAALDVLRHGLLVVIGDGHRDAVRTRAAALAVLIGLFASATKAAQAIGANRSTVHRAVKNLRKELQYAFCNGNTPQNINGHAALAAPERKIKQPRHMVV